MHEEMVLQEQNWFVELSKIWDDLIIIISLLCLESLLRGCVAWLKGRGTKTGKYGESVRSTDVEHKAETTSII